MSRVRWFTLAALLSLGASAACGRARPARVVASGDLLPEVRAAAAAGESEAVLDLWIGGEARLALACAGAARVGDAEVTVEEDDVRARSLGRIQANGEVVELVLPDGPRALRLRLPLDGTTWSLARLAELAPSDEPLESSEADGTAGPLAGRSVLVILCDSVAASHLSCYGNPRETTPNLDRLAAGGVRFATVYSQTAWTLPSVTSLFTSVEQERHGVVRGGLGLGPEPATLAELFRSAGYRTVGMVQNGAVGPHSGLGRGFDVYEPSRNIPAANLFERCVTELRSERPVFLYVHLLAPHMPYQPGAGFRGRFDPGYSGSVDGSVRSCAALSGSGKGTDDPDVVHLAALYDEYLCMVDAQIGAFLDEIAAAGLDRELAILFTSDHGEAFLQHGRQGHGPHVFDEMVRVPLILSAPGAPWSDGSAVDATASLLDVLPTLADLCGLAAPKGVRGASLRGAVLGSGTRSTRPLFLTSRYQAAPDGGAVRPEQCAVRVGPYKWVRDAGSGSELLFDLERDPAERVDLGAQRPILAAALRRAFERWRADASGGAARDAEIDAELARELQALGYAGEEDE